MNVATPPSNNEPSSIDRFFWLTGSKTLGRYGSSGILALNIVGGTQSTVALLLFIIELRSKNFPLVVPVAFAIAGIGMIVGAYITQRLNKNTIQPEIRLSGSARKMLYRIGQHVGWYDPNSYWHGSTARQGWWSNLMGFKTASQVLGSISGELLEAGCYQFNRLAGLQKLANEKDRRNAALVNQVRAAADEGMISLLNQAALIEESPETQSAIVRQAETQIEKLKELADRFEETLVKPETLIDRLSSTTIMDNLLDQMRNESVAKKELEEFDSQTHHQG